jgi:hypothetical protein
VPTDGHQRHLDRRRATNFAIPWFILKDDLSAMHDGPERDGKGGSDDEA